MSSFIVGALLLFASLVVTTLLGALFGAFAGWVVGWFFDVTLLAFFAELGIQGLEMWQIGMSLGFIGGFFKPVSLKG